MLSPDHASSNSHPFPQFAALIFLIILTGGLLSACTNAEQTTRLIQMAPRADLPSQMQNAPTTVREAYQFTITNPGIMQSVPCYCGCGSAGHTSNYSCYIQEVKPNGEILFDAHALGCSICVDITMDVMRMTREGKEISEIRDAIDNKYMQYGPSNMPSAP